MYFVLYNFMNSIGTFLVYCFRWKSFCKCVTGNKITPYRKAFEKCWHGDPPDILFENNLIQWRQLMGIPIESHMCGKHGLGSAPSTPEPMRASPISRSFRYSPYRVSSPTNSVDMGSEVTLSQILTESPKAAMLIAYYDQFHKFDEEQRSRLIAIIAHLFEDKGIAMSVKTSYRLEEEIIYRFPTESLVSY